MKILFIGDIFGECGKIAITNELSKLKNKHKIDFVIANAENTSLGRGLTWDDYHYLNDCGIDFFTMGNHTWHKKDIYEILIEKKNIIRPNNISLYEKMGKVGIGSKIIYFKDKAIRITNLLGSTVHFKNLQTNPFIDLENILEEDNSDIHIVDFHAETTSEKNAFFLNFQNRVTAILGTHTHVQTSDNKIVNNTAYITDVGMTGPSNGIIGAKPESIINMFMGQSDRFRLEEQIGKYQFSAVILEIDDLTNKPNKLEKVLIYEK